MKPIAVLAFTLTFAGCFASAQELTKQAKIERILAATNADAMLDQIFNQTKAMSASMTPAGTTPEQRAKAEEVQGKIMDLIKARISWDKMRPQYIKIYDEIFSDEEINGIVAFYESPSGRALLQKMPALISRTMTVTQSLMAEIMPEIQRIAKEAAEK